ncbi:transcription factor bHLH110-like [Ananas comosus]|uniref:Transcription factor bHLH110-like n=1 Tax=Ananas comosus TaxID=4615 RepID=A0A6P5FLU1_ANACO|nr:transcription factor bHLH110-like [Ananas comosus]
MHSNKISLPSWINTPPSMWHVGRSNSYSSSSCDDVGVGASASTPTTTLVNAAPNGGRSSLSTDPLSAAAAAVDGLLSEPMEHRLWSQLLLSSGNGGTMHNNHGVGGENFLDLLNSKSLAPELFDPAYESYPKPSKLGNNTYYEFTDTTAAPALNHLEALELSHYNPSMVEPSEIKMTHPSMNLATNWCSTAASPNPRYSGSNLYETHSSLSQARERSGLVLQQHHPSYMEPFNAPIDLNNSLMELNNKLNYSGVAELPWTSNRNFSDFIAFNGCLKKQEVGVKASKHCMMNSSESNERKKQAYEVTSIRGDGRNSGAASVGKKRKSEESSEALLKKPKNESSSAAASLRVQVPKVKMAEKITALQQIVSPFGKTDTASVLQETIVYIKFLHEQVQLLSDPYIKSSSCKDQNLWGVDQRKEKEEAKLELRSRGLCLVPLSCTSQVYRDNNGPDYWTLPYRSCLYR